MKDRLEGKKYFVPLSTHTLAHNPRLLWTNSWVMEFTYFILNRGTVFLYIYITCLAYRAQTQEHNWCRLVEPLMVHAVFILTFCSHLPLVRENLDLSQLSSREKHNLDWHGNDTATDGQKTAKNIHLKGNKNTLKSIHSIWKERSLDSSNGCSQSRTWGIIHRLSIMLNLFIITWPGVYPSMHLSNTGLSNTDRQTHSR